MDNTYGSTPHAPPESKASRPDELAIDFAQLRGMVEGTGCPFTEEMREELATAAACVGDDDRFLALLKGF